MEGGDLLRLIQREKHLSVESSRFYFLQLCQAVKHLHDQNITHRDIKPGINARRSFFDNCTLKRFSSFKLQRTYFC